MKAALRCQFTILHVVVRTQKSVFWESYFYFPETSNLVAFESPQYNEHTFWEMVILSSGRDQRFVGLPLTTRGVQTNYPKEGCERCGVLLLVVWDDKLSRTTTKATNKTQQFRFIDPFNQLYMFRELITPILRSTWLYLQLLVSYTDVAAGR
jgi:hypothetical protein